jgi:hypothetical protein
MNFDSSGALIHPSKFIFHFAKSYPHISYGQPSQFDPFIRAFGPLKLSGHEISGYDATSYNLCVLRAVLIRWAEIMLRIQIIQTLYLINSNPVSTIYRQYRGATAGTFITVINTSVDATKYDNGTGTLASVPGGQYSIQRLYYFPGEPTVMLVYYEEHIIIA